MRRTIALFLELTEKLDRELEKQAELFIDRRPVLESPGSVPEIRSLTDEEIEERVENAIAIEETISKIEGIFQTALPG